jgi:glycosyltransferase involved in cell wall biosynthesis
MNIVLINHYAGSPQYGMEYRPYYLAREWTRAGHSVTIVAASHSHVRTCQPCITGFVSEEYIDGIRYLWIKTPKYHSNSLRRFYNILAFLFGLYFFIPNSKYLEKPDFVISSSTYPMDIWPARRIAIKFSAKLIFEVHDLWPLSPIELGGMSRWHPFIIWVQAAEDFAYRNANIVISMLPNLKEYMISRGLKTDKLLIVPNGIDPEEWKIDPQTLPESVVKLFSKLKDEDKYIVGYAGSHGIANALNTLLDSAKIMKDEQLAFVLVGDGPEKSKLKQFAEENELDNVWFIEPVKKKQIPSLLKCFDIAYLGWKRQPIYRYGISPNKLMDYMMAGKPILHAVEASNDPVKEAKCGLTVAPEDSAALADGIKKLINIPEATRTAMGKRGREFVMKNHTYPVLAQRFISVCDDTVT